MSSDSPILVLATRNPGKLREIRSVLADLDVRIVGLDELAGDIPEPEETGETFADNARDKARYYAEALRDRGQDALCLADDSGLCVDALDGRPGVHSARFAADEANGADRNAIDQANNARLLRELANVPPPLRSARFVCHLALADFDGIVLETHGVLEGLIGSEAQGDNGFGYDPLFFVPAAGCTTAELNPEQKNNLSHRGQAVRQFAHDFRAFLKSRSP